MSVACPSLKTRGLSARCLAFAILSMGSASCGYEVQGIEWPAGCPGDGCKSVILGLVSDTKDLSRTKFWVSHQDSNGTSFLTDPPDVLEYYATPNEKLIAYSFSTSLFKRVENWNYSQVAPDSRWLHIDKSTGGQGLSLAHYYLPASDGASRGLVVSDLDPTTLSWSSINSEATVESVASTGLKDNPVFGLSSMIQHPLDIEKEAHWTSMDSPFRGEEELHLIVLSDHLYLVSRVASSQDAAPKQLDLLLVERVSGEGSEAKLEARPVQVSEFIDLGAVGNPGASLAIVGGGPAGANSARLVITSDGAGSYLSTLSISSNEVTVQNSTEIELVNDFAAGWISSAEVSRASYSFELVTRQRVPPVKQVVPAYGITLTARGESQGKQRIVSVTYVEEESASSLSFRGLRDTPDQDLYIDCAQELTTFAGPNLIRGCRLSAKVILYSQERISHEMLSRNSTAFTECVGTYEGAEPLLRSAAFCSLDEGEPPVVGIWDTQDGAQLDTEDASKLESTLLGAGPPIYHFASSIEGSYWEDIVLPQTNHCTRLGDGTCVLGHSLSHNRYLALTISQSQVALDLYKINKMTL